MSRGAVASPSEITFDQWRALYDRLETPENSQEAKTVREIAKTLGCSGSTVRNWLREGVERGWVRRIARKEAGMDGVARPTGAYLFVHPGKKSKK